MNIIKYMERIKRMDDLIRRRATGTPDEFAEKLEISRSALLKYIRVLKNMGAPVEFDEHEKCYRYTASCEFRFGFEEGNEKNNSY